MTKSTQKYLNGFFETLTEQPFFIKDETAIQKYINAFEKNDLLVSTALVSDNPVELTYRVPYFRLLYVLKGSIGIVVDQKEIEFFAGGAIIANPNTHIVYRGTSQKTEVATIIFKNAFFTTTFLNDLIDLPLFYDFVIQGLDTTYQKSNYFFFQCSFGNFSHFLLLFLFKEIINKKQKSAVKQSAFFLLLTELDQTKEETLVLKQSTLPSNLFIGEILKHINRNYFDVSLDQLAQLYNLHPNYLSVMIKNQTGKNFSEHLADVRIERASYYLRHSRLPIQQISEKVGYQDKSYFFRLFKKYHNCSPNQYRKQNKQQV